VVLEVQHIAVKLSPGGSCPRTRRT